MARVLQFNAIKSSRDTLNVLAFRLVKVEGMQIYDFPEVVVWCTEHYALDRKAIMSKDGKQMLCLINAESIAQICGVDGMADSIPLDDNVLDAKGKVMGPETHNELLYGGREGYPRENPIQVYKAQRNNQMCDFYYELGSGAGK